MAWNLSLSFSVEGEEYIARTLRVLWSNIAWWLRYEFDNIGQMLADDARNTIDTQSSETGGQFAPLAFSTQKARKNRTGYYRNPWMWGGASGPILKWTWRLRRGFRHTTDSDAMWVEVDNPVEYFKYHQAKIRQGRKLPRRLILEIKQRSKMKISNTIASGLQKNLPGGIFGRQY